MRVLSEKECTKCGVVKLFTDFGAAKGGVHGLRGMCRACYNNGRNLYYAKVREQKSVIRREYESRPEVRARRAELRNTDESKERARLTLKRYRVKPDVVKRFREYRIERSTTPEIRAHMIWVAAKARARKFNLPFSITEEWARSKMVKGVCEITGIPFTFRRHISGTRRNAFCPSIDQIIAGKGYTVENSRVVLIAINVALADWGLEQFLDLAQATLQHHGFIVTTKSVRKAA